MEQTTPRYRPSATSGLTAQQVSQRKTQGLVNTQPDQMTKTIGQIIRDNTLTWFNAFNFGIAICIALVGAYKNLLFLGVILLNILIGIVQEIRSKKMVEKLSVVTMSRADVVRDGKSSHIPVEELVLDDIIILSMGNQICADAIIREGQVEVNEALLTGEAEPIVKQSGELILSGSFVVSGKCRAQVEHVGLDNYATKIAMEAKKYKKVYSSLMNSLDKIVKFTSIFIIPFGILLVLHSQFILHHTIEDTVVATSAALLGMLPKGLVLLTSISLVLGVIKLANKKTLVQELFCIETLSRVDMLCLDKTGTLTQGKMTVSDCFLLDDTISLERVEEFVGTFVHTLDDNNATFTALKERFQQSAGWNSTHTTPFSSARKWSAVTFEGRGTVLIGAPEILLKGRKVVLPDKVSEAEASGSRVLLLAHTYEPVSGVLPSTLRAVAAIVLQDPIRPDAKETLDFFANQGVALKIISGDNPITVSSIAKQAGLKEYGSYVDASTLKTEEELTEAAAKCTIFGRVSPTQKRQLVGALKQQGHTVAMTGDGVNDVLALKDADCSIAMASGSDAARQVSQLVLLDSNFSALPSVVMEGRRVVNNITRTASLFLVKTIFSFLLSFISVFCNMPYPFIPIHLTLISVMAEGIPSFILAFEPNSERIQGNFLFTVLTRAFPSAIIIVLYIVIVNFLSPLLHVPALEITTLNLYLMGFAWLMQLLTVCRPFNKLRAVLWFGMFVGFYGGAVLFRELLSLGLLSYKTFPVFLVLAAACYPLQILFTHLFEKAARKFFPSRVNHPHRFSFKK